jgi:dTDP-4-dehydrorhamnose 3,5-epimerase-like enzyme
MKNRIKPLDKSEAETFPKSTLIVLENPYEDERGSIQPLVDVSMESCVLITSKKGTQRANHYHQTDWHYCYVISGEIEYHSRDVGSDAKSEVVHIRKGQLFFTGPLVEHTMYFVEDTVFLTLGRNSRSQEVYEADIIRIKSLIE